MMAGHERLKLKNEARSDARKEDALAGKNDSNRPTRTVTVCSVCFRAGCWQGDALCADSRSAGTVEKTRMELAMLGLEHSSRWKETE